MWFAIKRLALGLVLITGAAAVLLATDVRRSESAALPRIGILQTISDSVLDESVRGMVDGLAANGYGDGETARITLFNPQGEVATENAIAHQMTDGRFDLVITCSTQSLQAVANANKAGKTIHVFGIVTDPYACGVGLDAANPRMHPRHMVGQGTHFPVDELFVTARRMFPSLKTVGVAWDTGQLNSRRCVEDARVACAKMGITLMEAPVENTAGVRDAIHSLIGRGVQAVWLGGDSTVSSLIDSVVAICRQARIAVFSQLPGDPQRGTIFDLGVDFYEAGWQTGTLAAQILDGTDPATIPIRDVMDIVPGRLYINQTALLDLKDPWHVPDDLLRSADIVVDAAGVLNEPSRDHSKKR